MVKEAKIDPTSVIEPVAPDMLNTSVMPTKLVLVQCKSDPSENF